MPRKKSSSVDRQSTAGGGMHVARDSSVPEERLASLGLTPLEIELYVALLDGRSSIEELAEVSQQSSARVRVALNRLAERGLVYLTPGSRPRTVLAPPETALSALIRARERDLESSRSIVTELQSRYRRTEDTADLGDRFEIAVGDDAYWVQFENAIDSAQTQITACVGGSGGVVSRSNPAAERALARGVRIRVLLSRRVTEQPDGLRSLRHWTEAGEEIRVVDSLPGPFTVVDEALLALPIWVDPDERVQPAMLLTRESQVVQWFGCIFKLIWDTGVEVTGRVEPGELDLDLLACLSAGMKDAAIAKQLGISRRTLTRRLQHLFAELGVHTRFQAGMRYRERTRG